MGNINSNRKHEIYIKGVQLEEVKSSRESLFPKMVAAWQTSTSATWQQWLGWTGFGKAEPSGLLQSTECKYLCSSHPDVICGHCLPKNEKRINAFETKCLRRQLWISSREHKTSDFVDSMVTTLASHQETPSHNKEFAEAGLVEPCDLAKHFVHPSGYLGVGSLLRGTKKN